MCRIEPAKDVDRLSRSVEPEQHLPDIKRRLGEWSGLGDSLYCSKCISELSAQSRLEVFQQIALQRAQLSVGAADLACQGIGGPEHVALGHQYRCIEQRQREARVESGGPQEVTDCPSIVQTADQWHRSHILLICLVARRLHEGRWPVLIQQAGHRSRHALSQELNGVERRTERSSDWIE